MSERVTPPSPGEPDADPSRTAPPDFHVVDKRWWARDQSPAAKGEAHSSKPSYVEALKRQLAEKDEQLQRYAAKYKAQASEFEEARIRLRREVAKDVEREKQNVLKSFLDVVDNLDRALSAATATSERDETTTGNACAALVKGVDLVRSQFLATLKHSGVTRIEAAGQDFDPNLHEALSSIPVTDTAQDGVVVEVVKPGYLVGDEVLRPATVTVGKLTPKA